VKVVSSDCAFDDFCPNNQDLQLARPGGCRDASGVPANASVEIAVDVIGRIAIVRGRRVLLDTDLAALYAVTTKRLNEQVRRNRRRFPADFAFQLSEEEVIALRSQNATLDTGRGRYTKHRPWAFTEHGAIMVAIPMRVQTARASRLQLSADRRASVPDFLQRRRRQRLDPLRHAHRNADSSKVEFFTPIVEQTRREQAAR
jgi:hypothetical protein